MRGVKELKRGDWVLHNGEPYRVERKETVPVGTHSHSKIRIEMVSLYGKKDSVLKKPGDVMEDIEVIRRRGQVISKTDKDVQIMDLVSYETLNADIDEELLEKINEGDEVSFAEIKGIVRVLDKR